MIARTTLHVICAAFLTCLPPGAHAAEIHVRPDSPGIQAAIESAADGDEIIVAPGLYQEHINFLGKAITVRSTDPDDPDVVAATIIDGSGTGKCVTFENDEGPDSVLAGFTITNGNSTMVDGKYGPGGGVFCSYSSPTIVGNLIVSNRAERGGGGIGTKYASPLVTGNTIEGNTARYGAGIYMSPPIHTGVDVLDNVITGNSSLWGGGFDIGGFSETDRIVGNIITGNSSSSGGGVFLYSRHDAFLFENVIVGNSATWGGGILLSDSTVAMVHNVIAGNSAHWGGGIKASRCEIYASSNLIAGNSANFGAGIYVSDSSALISNNVLTLNSTNYTVAGVQCFQSSVRMLNNIVWGNFSTRFESYQIEVHGGFEPSTLYLADNIIEKVWNGVSVGTYGSVTWAGGNLSVPPFLVDPGHWDDNGTPDDYADDFFVMGDYHLLPGSRCIDAGTNDIDGPDTEAIEELPETDLAGLPRIMDGDANGTLVVDISAYAYLRGDANYDGIVSILDLILVRNNLGKDPSSYPPARRADVNADRKVDILDIIAVRNLISAW